jgi:hypothetical protein
MTDKYVKELGLQPPYRVVAKMTKNVQIDPNREGYVNPAFLTTGPVRRFAQVQVNDKDGNPAYDFECDAYRIVGDKIPQIAGDGLTCGLFMSGDHTNLLLDSVDPYSRMCPAIILAKQLQDPAARDPEWGTTRHFSLRGLSLTLRFSNPVFGKDEFRNPTLIRSGLTIEVEPDPHAETPVAKPPTSSYSGFFSDYGVGR